MTRNPERLPYQTLYEGLREYLERLFSDVSLPSHDASHHSRVWKYALFITSLLKKEGYSFSDSFMQQLLITCMTHDAGMCVDIGENHGIVSKELCLGFMNNENFPSVLREEVLFVVENHDRKDYRESYPPDSLFTILSVSDDTDALGYTGLYRYIEIYSARGISAGNMTGAILENAGRRFAHMKHVYGFMNDFINFAESRYNFLNEALSPGGACSPAYLPGIAGTINTGRSRKGVSIHQIAREITESGNDSRHGFFRRVLDELNERDMF